MMCNVLLCNAWARVSVSVQIYRFQDSEFAYFENRQEAAEWAREGRVNGDESKRDDLVRKSIHVRSTPCQRMLPASRFQAPHAIPSNHAQLSTC